MEPESLISGTISRVVSVTRFMLAAVITNYQLLSKIRILLANRTTKYALEEKLVRN